jgi:hypothetical protein
MKVVGQKPSYVTMYIEQMPTTTLVFNVVSHSILYIHLLLHLPPLSLLPLNSTMIN